MKQKTDIDIEAHFISEFKKEGGRPICQEIPTRIYIEKYTREFYLAVASVIANKNICFSIIKVAQALKTTTI